MRHALSLVLLLGCSSESAVNSAPDAGEAADGEARATPSCEAPGHATDDGASHVVSELVARLVRFDGEPPEPTLALLCGLDLCVYGSTDDQGDVTLTTSEPIKRPAFKYGDGLAYVKLAQLLPTDTSTYNLGSIAIAELPPFETGEPLIAGAEANSAGVSVRVPDGATVKIDLLTYTTDAERGFRAVAIPVPQAPPAVDSTLGFEIVIATAPDETHFCPEATLSVPNSAGWPADSTVEIWLHGTDPSEQWAPYAGWAKVSDARVTADGTAVVSLASDGIPVLGVFGLRKP